MGEKKVVTEEVREENSNTKKKCTKAFLMVIAVCIVVCFAFGIGMFVGQSSSEKEKSDNSDKDEVSEGVNDDENIKLVELTKDSEVVKKLFDYFNEVENDLYNIHESHDFTDINVRKSFAVKVLKKENKTKNSKCGSLSISYTGDGYFCNVYDIVYDDLGNIDYKKYSDAVKDSETMTFSAEDLKNQYLTLFGKDEDYKDESFMLTIYPSSGYAYYDVSNNLYAHFSNGGGSEGVSATHVLNSIEQNGLSLKLFTTLTLEDENNTVKSIIYSFEYETETGNYIFVNRTEG